MKLHSLGIVAAGLSAAACSTSAGQVQPETHFVFPNANVQASKAVSAEISRTRFLLPPKITVEWVEAVQEKALSESGSDFLINSSFDVKTTQYPFFFTTTLTLTGTAATQQIGQQELK